MEHGAIVEEGPAEVMFGAARSPRQRAISCGSAANVERGIREEVRMPEASGTTINLVVSGVAARAVLWPDFAPKSVAALVRSLPLELPLQHCKWSGLACFAELTGGAISTIEGLETPVISIYAGVLGVAAAASRPAERRIAARLRRCGIFRQRRTRRRSRRRSARSSRVQTLFSRRSPLHRHRGTRDASVDGC